VCFRFLERHLPGRVLALGTSQFLRLGVFLFIPLRGCSGIFLCTSGATATSTRNQCTMPRCGVQGSFEILSRPEAPVALFQVSKTIATFTTFLISAILHELLFSVAFKTLRPWFFVGMLVQVCSLSWRPLCFAFCCDGIPIADPVDCGEPVLPRHSTWKRHHVDEPVCWSTAVGGVVFRPVPTCRCDS
jgi:hypothetical protein